MNLLCAILSDCGRQICEERGMDQRWMENHVYLIELLLILENFMKMKSIPIEYMLDERRLGKAMDHVLFNIKSTINRNANTMRNDTIKNHLLLHLPQYGSRWGPFTGMDSGDSERNHKSQVKPQSKIQTFCYIIISF